MTIFDDILGPLSAEQLAESERLAPATKTEMRKADVVDDEPLGDLVQLDRLEDF